MRDLPSARRSGSDDAVLDREVNHELHPKFRLTSPDERTTLSAGAYRQL
jgi:hypothetical protein